LTNLSQKYNDRSSGTNTAQSLVLYMFENSQAMFLINIRYSFFLTAGELSLTLTAGNNCYRDKSQESMAFYLLLQKYKHLPVQEWQEAMSIAIKWTWH